MSSNAITPGMVIGARYRVVKQLGEGGVGAVYLVQHVHTDERLALKVLHSETRMDPSTVERFRNEARAPARIDSDHIARVTDADVAPELNGAPFLVMEYLRGRDLSGEVEARKSLDPKEVVLYLRQAARALDKAHGLGIIHRDLKPENIFLTVREDGTPCIKLLDFGIAKLTGASAGMGGQSKTKTGAIYGTPLYMAPEQARAHTHLIGPHTDVWAIGLIAVRLLLGCDYWQAETISDLVVQIVVDPIPPPSQKGANFGPAFDAWFLRCCNRDIAQRFRSVGEAITELAVSLGIAEGPKLALEVAEILERARATEGSSVKTVEAAPLAVSGGGTSVIPAATPAPNPSTHVPAGAAPISPSTVMGSTQVASSTAMGMQAGTTGAPVRTSASNKTPLLAIAAVVLLGLIGGAAFLGLRQEGSPKNTPAAESEVVPLPTPQLKVAVPADPPAVEPTAPIETAAVAPSASAAPVQAATKAANTPANTTTNSGRTKTSPVPTTTNKKPNDDDLMSGRR